MIDLEKIELATSVDLGLTVKDKDVYHFVYGSQLYGTLFGVYAKFYPEIKSGSTAEVYVIEGIELHLLNYQGVLNLGFLAAPLIETPEPQNRKLEIDFFVQGGSVFLKTPVYQLQKTIELKRGERYTIVFNRTVCPIGATISAIDQNDGPVANPTMRIPQPITNSPYYDTEFEYRNGLDHFPSVLRPGMLGYKEVKQQPTGNDKSLEMKFMPSGRCHSSTVNLIF